MPARLSAWLRSGDALDLAIALVALAVVLLEVHGSLEGRLAVEFHPSLYALYVLQTLPLAFRRRAPIAVFFVVALSDFAVALPFAPPGLDLPAASYIALQIANYTLNENAPRAVTIAGVVEIIRVYKQVQLDHGVQLGVLN